jgi:hypothetical protein
MLEFHVEHYLTLCPPASAEPTTQMVRQRDLVLMDHRSPAHLQA